MRCCSYCRTPIPISSPLQHAAVLQCNAVQCQARGQVWSQYTGCLWLWGLQPLQSLQRYQQELITESVIIRAAENIFLKTCCWWHSAAPHSAVTWKMVPSPARAPCVSLAPAIIALPFLFFQRTTTNCSLYWMQPQKYHWRKVLVLIQNKCVEVSEVAVALIFKLWANYRAGAWVGAILGYTRYTGYWLLNNDLGAVTFTSLVRRTGVCG